MSVEFFEVLENQVNGHYHAIPEGETNLHTIGSDCHCVPSIEIYAERNGGKRVHRHRPIQVALMNQIKAVQETIQEKIKDLRECREASESD